MSTDATQVTGSTATDGAPRPGDVLAERYELLEVVDSDGPALSYRALDQESERPVLVRVLTGEPLPAGEAEQVLARLRGLVGVGGRYLGSLLDADQERGAPFTVEAWPRGTQLSAILSARRARSEALGAQETLPVVGQLAAALQALPEPLCHGDVRAERVWLDTDGLRLTGAHLLAALEPATLRARLAKLGPGAVAYPPEAVRGELSSASDRWGVASIAWEALTGRSPDPDATSPEVQGPLREALKSLLSERPVARPADLTRLIATLASKAKLAVPRIDPEAYRPPTARLPSKRPSSIPVVPRPRKIAGAAEDGTQEVSLDQIIEERAAPKGKPRREASVDSLDPRLVRAALGVSLDSEEEEAPSSEEHVDDTAKHDALSVEDAVLATSTARGPDSLDPRLVRAALDVELDSEDAPAAPAAKPREPSIDGLDPRLVRAALGVTLEDSAESGVEELDSDLIEESFDLEEDDDEPAARALPARPPGAPPASRPAAPPPGKLAARPPSSAPARPTAKPLGAGPPKRPPPSAGPPRATLPKAPPPSRPASPGPSGPGHAGPASAPPVRPAGPPAASAISPPPPAGPQLAAAPEAAPSPPPPDPVTPVAAAEPGPGHARPIQAPEPNPMATSASAPKPRPARSSGSGSITGVVIVLVAMIVAVLIIGVGFMIASHRRSEAARQRELDQRWEQIQQQQSEQQQRSEPQ